MANFTVHADSVEVNAERDTLQVTLTGVDIFDLVSEFNAKELLAEIDTAEIHDYLRETLGERDMD